MAGQQRGQVEGLFSGRMPGTRDRTGTCGSAAEDAGDEKLAVLMVAYRVALYRVNGCLSGYKSIERCDQEVVIRFDTYHGGSPRRCFRLLRVSHFEQVGCRELAVFLEDVMIWHGLCS